MPIFGKRPAPPIDYVPIDLVRRLAAEGLTEPQIGERLRAHGFTQDQVDRAMRTALKAEIEAPAPPAPFESQTAPQFPRPAPQTFVAPPAQAVREAGVPPERILPPEPRPLMLAEAPAEFGGEELRPLQEGPAEITLEEVIEGVVAERWAEFEDRLTSFEKRDIQLQSQIEDMRKKISELEAAQKTREKDLIGRFEDFGESMTGIEGRIAGIEHVFKDFLPELTETTRAMAEIVEKAKKEK